MVHNKMMSLDFSPLTEPVSVQDLINFNKTKKYGLIVTHGRYWSAIVFSSVFCLLTILLFIYVLVSSNSGLGWIAILLVNVSIVIFVGVIGARNQAVYLSKLMKFAAANKLQLSYDVRAKGYKGMIFDEGQDNIIKEAIAFPDGSEIGNYVYNRSSGGGKSAKYGFARISLNRKLPHMVLDAKQNNIMSVSNLPEMFDRSQRLKLEGNFNKYFDVYVPKKYEADALYVFTPDVMQAILDHGRRYDMEVVDDQLFFYTSNKIALDKPEVLREMMAMTAAISHQVVNQTKRYSDARVVGAKSGLAVTSRGRRLRNSVSPAVIVVSIVTLIITFTFLALL
jgi:hypothetical protein